MEKCVNCLRLSIGLCPLPGTSSRGYSGLIFDDEVIEVRTVKRVPEERQWQAERFLRLDALATTTSHRAICIAETAMHHLEVHQKAWRNSLVQVLHGGLNTPQQTVH